MLPEGFKEKSGTPGMVKALQSPVEARGVRQVLNGASFGKYKITMLTPAIKARHINYRKIRAVEK